MNEEILMVYNATLMLCRPHLWINILIQERQQGGNSIKNRGGMFGLSFENQHHLRENPMNQVSIMRMWMPSIQVGDNVTKSYIKNKQQKLFSL